MYPTAVCNYSIQLRLQYRDIYIRAQSLKTLGWLIQHQANTEISAALLTTQTTAVDRAHRNNLISIEPDVPCSTYELINCGSACSTNGFAMKMLCLPSRRSTAAISAGFLQEKPCKSLEKSMRVIAVPSEVAMQPRRPVLKEMIRRSFSVSVVRIN